MAEYTHRQARSGQARRCVSGGQAVEAPPGRAVEVPPAVPRVEHTAADEKKSPTSALLQVEDDAGTAEESMAFHHCFNDLAVTALVLCTLELLLYITFGFNVTAWITQALFTTGEPADDAVPFDRSLDTAHGRQLAVATAALAVAKAGATTFAKAGAKAAAAACVSNPMAALACAVPLATAALTAPYVYLGMPRQLPKKHANFTFDKEWEGLGLNNEDRVSVLRECPPSSSHPAHVVCLALQTYTDDRAA